MKTYTCQCCGQKMQLKNNSIKSQLQNKTDKVIIAVVNEYAVHSESYDKNKLSILMQFKRKLIEYNSKQNLTN